MERTRRVEQAMILALQNYFFSRNNELLYFPFQSPRPKPRDASVPEDPCPPNGLVGLHWTPPRGGQKNVNIGSSP